MTSIIRSAEAVYETAITTQRLRYNCIFFLFAAERHSKSINDSAYHPRDIYDIRINISDIILRQDNTVARFSLLL